MEYARAAAAAVALENIFTFLVKKLLTVVSILPASRQTDCQTNRQKFMKGWLKNKRQPGLAGVIGV